ncbi:hypothetical protein [Pontiella sulfatireligans]|uniref:Uncharacterized protein n=1 Tax=Pontiella sulfatireligans TaxID=2750658 RepID=A0A6C2UDX6_9BACT|nr:hypothetical protein [Pontiella sulfatireligans]VGO18345.1 hypothetical protein SCARR_00397 [Pontiella sulfatireligans]
MKCSLYIVALLFSAGVVQGASVLDIFPDTGTAPVAGSSSCSFDYKASGSTWTEGIHEEQVFLASIQGDGWKMGVGKGGQIYSLRGPFGESVPPQRVESPWNDEVWQAVITSEPLIAPLQDYQNANPKERAITTPLMYFVHQAGIYTKGAGMENGTAPAPFYSPCLRKRWNPETRTLELVNWMQQARTPCVWKSGVLIYTAYRDLGEGIIEVNQVLHNFGSEKLTFLNVPWGGVRQSSLPHTIMSRADGSWAEEIGTWGWVDLPTRTLKDAGGWEAWTQNTGNEASPSLALVFGFQRDKMDEEWEADSQVIRWGSANSETRDYQVTERICHINVEEGDSLSIRWYLVAGEFSKVWKHAANLVDKAGVSRIQFDADKRQSVWIVDGKVVTEGNGKPSFELFAFPVEGTVPVFLLKDKRTVKQIISTDIYAMTESEPYPNPLPEELPFYSIYNDRSIYKQYAPHIGYQNLLGYAFKKKPASMKVQKLAVSKTKILSLDTEAYTLWIPAAK